MVLSHPMQWTKGICHNCYSLQVFETEEIGDHNASTKNHSNNPLQHPFPFLYLTRSRIALFERVESARWVMYQDGICELSWFHPSTLKLLFWKQETYRSIWNTSISFSRTSKLSRSNWDWVNRTAESTIQYSGFLLFLWPKHIFGNVHYPERSRSVYWHKDWRSSPITHRHSRHWYRHRWW